MKSRIFIAMLWILFVWALIFLLPGWCFTSIVAAVIAMSMFEFFNMIQKKRLPVYRYFGITIGVLIPISAYFNFKPTEGWEFLLMVAVCLAVFLLQFTKRKTENVTSGVAITIFAIFYISWFFSFVIKIRFAELIVPDGRMMVAFLLIVTKAGDIGAYFLGTRFGAHQLIPRISPKKSVEGTIGGFLFSFLGAFLCAGLMPQIELIHIAILGVLLGVLGQIGDLSESLIKRDCLVKDSGSAFAGFGGMFDLIDSLLFACPIFYFYMRFLS